MSRERREAVNKEIPDFDCDEWLDKRKKLQDDLERAAIALVEHAGPVAGLQLPLSDGGRVVVTVEGESLH